MDYWFINVTTEFGPLNFVTYTDCHDRNRNTITKAVVCEAIKRGMMICHDWIAEPIDESTYKELW